VDEQAKRELTSIIDGLSAESREFIAALPEDRVGRLHFGLGVYIRNEHRQGRLTALFRWARTQISKEPMSFDSLSRPILREVWKQVKSSAP
jgi:hypothetical protein